MTQEEIINKYKFNISNFMFWLYHPCKAVIACGKESRESNPVPGWLLLPIYLDLLLGNLLFWICYIIGVAILKSKSIQYIYNNIISFIPISFGMAVLLLIILILFSSTVSFIIDVIRYVAENEANHPILSRLEVIALILILTSPIGLLVLKHLKNKAYYFIYLLIITCLADTQIIFISRILWFIHKLAAVIVTIMYVIFAFQLTIGAAYNCIDYTTNNIKTVQGLVTNVERPPKGGAIITLDNEKYYGSQNDTDDHDIVYNHIYKITYLPNTNKILKCKRIR